MQADRSPNHWQFQEIRLCALLGAVAFVAPLSPSAWAQTVTSTDAMRKVKIDTDLSTIPTSPSAAISAARNEFEAFQVIIRGPASNVSASVTNLIRPGGDVISGASCGVGGNVRLYREAIINITQSSGGVHGGTGGYPDGLVPDVDEVDQQCRNAFPFDVPAGENRVLWVEVYVPATAAPGSYTGNVLVSYAGGSTTIPVTLTVWDFDLPATASLRSYFGLSYGSIYVQHVAPDPCCTDAHAEIRYKYSLLGLDHRISTPNFDDGWGFGTWSHYDGRYGPLIDGTAPTRLSGAKVTSMNMMESLDDQTKYDNWATHFSSRGWFDRLFAYICDEPPYINPWNVIPPRGGYAHSGNHPNFRTLVTTTIARAINSPIGDVSRYINILVPNVTDIEGTRSQYDAWLQTNSINEVWEYLSCNSHGCGSGATVAWPDYVIDEEMTQARALEWISFRNRLSGELYYDTTFAYAPGSPNDPWTNQFHSGGNGDGTLFLPGTPARVSGTTHIPVATLRLKMIREGMEDYEYMNILAGQNDRAFAESQIDAVFATPHSTDPDPILLYNARRQMACRILSNRGLSCPTP